MAKSSGSFNSGTQPAPPAIQTPQTAQAHVALTNAVGPALSRQWLALNFPKLEDWWPLTPEEVALILDRSVGQLADDRMAGLPPPFSKDKGNVIYKAGDIRDYLKELRSYKSTAEASVHKKELRAGYKPKSFSAFVNDAGIDDQWPFTILAGKPVDFFAALELDIAVRKEASCRWMTLGEYLRERLAWAETEPRLAEAAKLRAGTKAAAPRESGGLGKGSGPL